MRSVRSKVCTSHIHYLFTNHRSWHHLRCSRHCTCIQSCPLYWSTQHAHCSRQNPRHIRLYLFRVKIELCVLQWRIIHRILPRDNNTITLHFNNLTIIELRIWPYVWPCVWQPTPKTADVTVTRIAGYVRVCILMNRWFFPRIFGIHSCYATATLLNIWICMQWTGAADGGCGGGQCDVNIPGISPRRSRSKAVANNYRQEYHYACGHGTLVAINAF